MAKVFSVKLKAYQRKKIYSHVLSGLWLIGIWGIYNSLQGNSTETVLIAVVFTIAFSCPCLWAVMRAASASEDRRRVVVVPKKAKKKADIAKAGEVEAAKTQAEMLAAQRKKAKKLHGVVGKKKKKGKPARKARPS